MKLKYYAKSPVFGRERNFEQTIEMTEDIRGIESQVVNIYPELSYETFEGFGGAVTEAAGYIYSLMNDEQKKKVIETYFSPEKMNYRLVRVHMDSCDFSLGLYEAMSNSEDTELKSFSFERTEKYILPMLEDAKKTAGEKSLVSLAPYKKRKVGIVTTGNEVFYGRIKDTFTPVIIEKMKSYGAEIHGHILCNDDMEKITAAIMKLKEEGADLIVCTGGMSVDPDDKTPGAIKNTGARIVSYGAPVLPGAMFLLSYLEDGTPVMGLPGCVMYAKATVFDLVLPRIIAGIEVTKKDMAHMGNGGFCLGCKECHYPNCSFGKGV